MSLRLRALNTLLRLTERPHIARATPQKLRSSIEARARIFFPPPRGTTCTAMTLGAVPALSVEAGRMSERGGVIYYLHGGAFIFGSPNVYRGMLGRLSQLTGWRAVLPNYRKAPEHPFPAGPDDVRSGWEALMASGVAAQNVIVGGDSAGGNLALVLLADLIRDGAPLPGGVFALSPVTDLTYSSPSLRENADSDVVLPAERAGELGEMYLQGHDPSDPRASPLVGTYEGAPPVYIAVGTTEMLRDDSLRMADHLRGEGVDVTVELGENLPHVWPLFRPMIPQADATLRKIAEWIKQQPETAGES